MLTSRVQSQQVGAKEKMYGVRYVLLQFEEISLCFS